MAKAQKRSKQRYLEWLQHQIENRCELTQDDAFRILEGQFLLLDEEEIDVGLVDECLDYLIPNRAEREYPMEETWQRVVEKAGLGKEADKRQSKRGIGHHRRRLHPALAIALLLFAIMLVGTTIASALGFNVWDSFVKWRGDMLYVETEMTETDIQQRPAEIAADVYARLAGELDCFSEELKKSRFTVKLPTWKPEGFAAVQAQTLESLPSQIIVAATYEHTDGRQFFIDVDWLNAPTSMEIERNPDETPTVYTREDKVFYWVTNIDHKVLTWMDAPYVVTISGNLTDDELKKMIDSMFEEDNP